MPSLTRTGLLLAGLALLGMPHGGSAQTVAACKSALQRLSTAPYNTSLPFMSAATGECLAVKGL